MNGIILFGDSVLFGTGASTRNKGCGKLLRDLLDRPILIRSHNRDTTEDALKRIERDVLNENDYSQVVILFGNNDCRLKSIDTPTVSLPLYLNNLAAIIGKIKFSGKIPLICNLQPISSEGFYRTLEKMKEFIKMDSTPYLWHKKYSDICQDVSGEENIALIDIRTPLEENINSVLSSDGLHPNDLGHQIIAHQILTALKT